MRRFEELDYQPTPIGALSLRRRHDAQFDTEVYEIKLDDDFLMSSLFTVGEVELARLGLAACAGTGLDVVVGGLGLGYTALTVIEDVRVRSLVVVEALDAVIGWHRRGLLPAGVVLADDPRCRFVAGDFMALNAAPSGLDPQMPGRRFDAVIVDIDHSPEHLLHTSHAAFYRPAGLAQLAGHLVPGGVFALWSNDPPDRAYLAVLAGAFTTAKATVVSFDNPLQGRTATNTVYLARA